MVMRRTYKVVIEIETNNDGRWLEAMLRENFSDVIIDGGRITHVEIVEEKE
jgi:hypothetical protein